MTPVFVHGVPDTHRLWNRVRSHLSRRDVVAVDLPGFGCGAPPGFPATKEAYVEWLIERVEAIGRPVDLVGHDWGGILVQRLAAVRPDLVRTWAAGCGPMDPQYEWHEIAKIWQTPVVGEQFMDGAFTPEGVRATAGINRVPPDDAEVQADHVDALMKDCILRLYRSAIDVSAEWGPSLDDAPSHALVLWGDEDPFAPADIAFRSADRVGGRAVVFDECGHWWPLERPHEVARLLEELWASV